MFPISDPSPSSVQLLNVYPVGEEIAIGADEIFEDKESIKLVEWPEKVWQIIPNKVIKVNIEKIDETKRKIIVED